MDNNRGRLLYAALVIADASWMFALLATVGMIFGLGTSPLSWPVLAALLGLSIFVGWVAAGVRGDFVTIAILQGGVGLLVIYGAVALRSAEGVGGMEWGWLPRLAQGDLGQVGGAGAVVALIAALYLWRRGMRKIEDDTPADSLHATFKWGIAAIAAALITEIVRDETVGMRIIVVPFFGATLGGMALGRLAEPGSWGAVSKIWSRVILGTVAGILSLGLLFGLAGSTFGGGPLRGIGTALAAIRDGIFWVVSIPLSYVAGALFAFFQWLVDTFGNNEPEPLQVQGAAEGELVEQAEQATEAVGSGIIETLVSILVWPVVAIIILAILYFLVMSLRRIRRRDQQTPDSERESIRGDANARKDLANLLARLLPDFLRRRSAEEYVLRYPPDEPGITEIFRLYYRCLTLALERGAEIDPHLTPSELRVRLEESLPRAPVGLLTERFNAACYGHEPSRPDVIRGIEAGLSAVPEPGS